MNWVQWKLLNKRTVYKYIHLEGLKSCQLVMGLPTMLAPGSVWNSIPPHTHTRRMEVYLYFDLPAEHRIMHFMGEPQRGQHLMAVMRPSFLHHGVPITDAVHLTMVLYLGNGG